MTSRRHSFLDSQMTAFRVVSKDPYSVIIYRKPRSETLVSDLGFRLWA